MQAPITASLIAPVYNEEGNLLELVREVVAALSPSGFSWELLLVDDGSSDNSWQEIEQSSQAHQEVRGIKLAQNCGQTTAFACGFKEAKGDYFVTLDADLQNDPADIPRLLEELISNNADGVIGFRAKRNDSWLRRIASKIANSYRRSKTDDDTIDTGCSLKIFKKDYLRNFPLFAGMHRYIPTLARLAGAKKILQLEVNHRPRIHGESKYGIWDRLWVGIADVKAVNWMQRRHRPYQIESETDSNA